MSFETLREDVGGETRQAGLEIAEAAGTPEEIPHHEERPAVPYHFERLGHGAALPVRSSAWMQCRRGLDKKASHYYFASHGSDRVDGSCARGLRASVHRRPHAAAPRSTRGSHPAPASPRRMSWSWCCRPWSPPWTGYSSAGSGRERSPACPRVSARDAHADHVGRRHGRRGLVRPSRVRWAPVAPARPRRWPRTPCSSRSPWPPFSPFPLLGGPALYRAMGGRGRPSRPPSPIRTSCSAARSSSGF